LTSQLEVRHASFEQAQQDKTFAESVLAQQLATWRASPARQNLKLRAAARGFASAIAGLQSSITDDQSGRDESKNDIAKLKQKIAESSCKLKIAPPDKSQKRRASLRKSYSCGRRFTSTIR